MDGGSADRQEILRWFTHQQPIRAHCSSLPPRVSKENHDNNKSSSNRECIFERKKKTDLKVFSFNNLLSGRFGPSDVSVILGEYDLQRREGPDLAVSHVIVHENFVRKTFTHDIALVRLESRVTFSNRIYPICLPSGNEVLDGKWATVVGEFFLARRPLRWPHTYT